MLNQRVVSLHAELSALFYAISSAPSFDVAAGTRCGGRSGLDIRLSY